VTKIIQQLCVLQVLIERDDRYLLLGDGVDHGRTNKNARAWRANLREEIAGKG
jgi:hypothetical protein